MKLLKLLLVVSFFVGFVNAHAQTNDKKKSNEEKAKMERAAAQYKANHPKEPLRTQKQKVDVITGIDTNDPYMGRTNEFLSRLTVPQLPADFPKYQTSYGVAGYNDVVDNYYRSHGSIVKDWVKQKLNIQ